MLGCTACDTFTLRVYAHVIRKHADEVANTFAAAVDGDTEAAATDPTKTTQRTRSKWPVSKSVSKTPAQGVPSRG
ncbi:hypothetical protein GCM10009742_35750 [Kribbella karoonensis]|uniref:Phage integrase family protein n=1 Tax=Kribbella karoonensis TaxID=324851 RepID=A0ABP4PNE6_9ACTN